MEILLTWLNICTVVVRLDEAAGNKIFKEISTVHTNNSLNKKLFYFKIKQFYNKIAIKLREIAIICYCW